MIAIKQINYIESKIKEYKNIDYWIINNTIGKNLILLNSTNNDNLKELSKQLDIKFGKYIQEVILEFQEEDELIIKEIKSICKKNSIIHRNISYLSWNRKHQFEEFKNIIAGYSFKGGMGRSTTLAYLSYFYYLTGKKIVVLDCDFEAPGIASMFFDKEKRKQSAGILDYLIDLNIEEEPKLNDYFLQTKVSDNSGNLFIFPSGIDFDINNYLNKISKIDFNSPNYTNGFIKLLNNINNILKPDLIFIDLRAGINESNRFILQNISHSNLLFFNSEAQNEDGLKVIFNLLDSSDKNYIMNSTIRYSNSELRKLKEEKLVKFVKESFQFNDENIIPIKYNSTMLESTKSEFEEFVNKEFEIYKTTKSSYLHIIIETINDKYSLKNNIDTLEIKNTSNLEDILKKLEIIFSKLTGTQQFQNNDDLKYFYLKDDISKIINEQIFLILGSKGSGKSTLFEVFTKHHKDILSKLNIKNNNYIAGFSKIVMGDISKDYISKIYQHSNKKTIDIERFWKFITLYQIEKYLNITNKYFDNFDDISNKFTDFNIGLDIDKRLKLINIDLYKEDKIVTLVYDELDIGFSEDNQKLFISSLISFWQDNIYKYSQIKSKILLRNDIFNTLDIENKTHLDLNKYKLKWTEKEILSLILKIFISALNENELDQINLLEIVKNKKNKEVTEDIEKIKEAIYLIFDKQLSKNRPVMDKWIMTRLSDSKGLITPRIIYKFMSESIKQELIQSNRLDKSYLLTTFSKNWENILTEVSKYQQDEYNAEYKDNYEIYQKIKKIGQRSFTYEVFKKQYPNRTLETTVKNNLKKLESSGFISYDERQKKYQVAYIYTYGLGLKINRSKGIKD